MKNGIHPKYNQATVTCSTCGYTFVTGSTMKEICVDTCANCHPFFTGKGSTMKEIRVDTCANCHPFFTGKQKFNAADGRIDRFNKRYNIEDTNNK